MKICVVSQAYPDSKKVDNMAFTHVRNLDYVKQGHEVSVLSFDATFSYEWDGISVHPESSLTPEKIKSFDVFVFHAPNLRNHLRFMLKHNHLIPSRVIVAHGHEFVHWSSEAGYPMDYQKTWKTRLRAPIFRLYDKFKIRAWAWYFKSQKGSGLSLIFVSKWLRQTVEQHFGFDLSSYIRVFEVNNPIHPRLRNEMFDPNCAKLADFVTIRPFDGPKYAVDICREFAIRHPQWTFDVYGEGEFFDFYPPPPNMRVFKRKFPQNELPELLNNYRAMLLPTRWDSQGVLMCEAACFGMPVVVSDIPICKTMVGEFRNVSFVQNEDPKLERWPGYATVKEPYFHKFDPENTVMREIGVLESAAKEARNTSTRRRTVFLPGVLSLMNLLAIR